MSIQNGDIDMLWQKVYSMTQSQSGPQTWGSFLMLMPRFDQDLLNDISKLKTLYNAELTNALEEVRSKFAICQASGLIGDKDMELVNTMIDKIAKERGGA
jgi:hypothetical protein